MNEITDALLQGAISIAVILIGAAATYAANFLRKFLTRISNTEAKKELVDRLVKAAEQTLKEATSADKLNYVTAQAEQECKARGIPFNADQIKTLIEAAVHDFKGGFTNA